MWLPIPIYERMPQVWLLLGLMLMYSGIYLTFDYTLSYLYSGAGLISAAWGIWVFSRRVAARKGGAAQASESAAADAQTELLPPAQAQHDGMSQSAETQT